jgi:hypothetical protein
VLQGNSSVLCSFEICIHLTVSRNVREERYVWFVCKLLIRMFVDPLILGGEK